MPYTPFMVREGFHLYFLRHFARRLNQRNWTLKGGVCLRFFHGSPRISEDIDFDVGNISKQTLEKAVDQILSQRPLVSDLSEFGVQSISRAKPKQTETSQRWNVHIEWSGGEEIITRIECSRRRKGYQDASAIPEGKILAEFHSIPFVVRYYPLNQMINQKIEALADPKRSAARDLFDLDHLFSRTGEPVAFPHPATILESASRQAERFSVEDFRREVCPFLPEDLGELYRRQEHFKEIQNRVINGILKVRWESGK